MKATNFSLYRYDADEGKVFDWKEPHYIEDSEGNQVQEHLYAKTLFISSTDAIENYIEIDAAGNITELTTPDYATQIDYEKALSELGVK